VLTGEVVLGTDSGKKSCARAMTLDLRQVIATATFLGNDGYLDIPVVTTNAFWDRRGLFSTVRHFCARAATFAAVDARARCLGFAMRPAASGPELRSHPTSRTKDAVQQRWYIHVGIELRPV
jgi:hypothetical protein